MHKIILYDNTTGKKEKKNRHSRIVNLSNTPLEPDEEN